MDSVMQTQAKYKSFRWLPNGLSASRGVLAVVMYWAAAHAEWRLALGILCVALVTDFLDGLAAKKLHAESTLGGHIDRVSDFLLAVAGVLGLSVGGIGVSLWPFYILIPISLFIGYVKFFIPEETLLRRITSIFSLLLLFLVWIYIAWGLLTEAFGWSWAYPVATFLVLLGAARLKRHRLRTWFGWISTRSKQV